jgi:hypothetical protein
MLHCKETEAGSGSFTTGLIVALGGRATGGWCLFGCSAWRLGSLRYPGLFPRRLASLIDLAGPSGPALYRPRLDCRLRRHVRAGTLFVAAWPGLSALAADQIGDGSLQVIDSAAQPFKVHFVRCVLPRVIMAVPQSLLLN